MPASRGVAARVGAPPSVRTIGWRPRRTRTQSVALAAPALPPAPGRSAAPPRRSSPPKAPTTLPVPHRGPAARSGRVPDAPPRRPKLPIPDAPGPRPERPARPSVPPRAPALSTVRFRTTETGTVHAVPVPAGTPVDEPVDAPAAPPDGVLPPLPSPRTAFRKRYGVVYDTQGPKVRLGVAWGVIVVASLVLTPLRPYGLATVYGVVAGVAALQVVDAWRRHRNGADRWVAALGASSLPVLATLGVRVLGAALMALVLAGLAAAWRQREEGVELFSRAGHTVGAAGVCGLAAASLVLLADYEIGAVLILLVYVMVYDASDYLVGSGASNGIEGPLAGILAIVAVTMVFAFTNVPPFRGADIWNFAVLAVMGCPVGQLVASAMLPRAGAFAPALRRIDSVLVVGPAWAGLVGLYLQRVSG